MSPDAGRAPPLRVLGLSGSLRRRSGNTALLRAAARLASGDISLTVYDGLASLPLFNPDDEMEALPASAEALRRLVGASDALLIACPEYAHGVPGPFKNLLDWLVGSLEFPDKPVVLWNASARGSHHAQDALREILRTMSARLLEPAFVTVPLPGAGCDEADLLADVSQVALVREALGALTRELARATGG
ncbi:NADPH-dependent FMN reductase [Dyella amyloliquefaciens]|uniref:NADPH-dependent FMN reductase n=1 Tax=Dyella amyloliquefaciens TaxID=1770545 RepID=UPI001E394AE0|nr:NADPH-dependent FMN reductase [Dyella amyloliquefaciens]